MLFLSETKQAGRRLEWLRWRMGMTMMVAVDSDGASGSLALFWKKNLNLTVQSMSMNHIDAVVKEADGFIWRYTGVYGEPRQEDRKNTWELLRSLKTQMALPWVVSGDFNEILFSCEKVGGSQRSESLMHNFRDALEECDLHDLGFVGDAFTWRNNHHDVQMYIKERLDRAVANGLWRSRFPLVRVINGDPRQSDHMPVILETGGRGREEWVRPMEILKKFEARWLEEEDCGMKVEEAWTAALEDGCERLVEIERKVLTDLWAWDKMVLGDLEKRIRRAKADLERCRLRNVSQEQVNREHILRFKLERLEEQHHIYWKQQAHSSWLIKGDRNTKIFHAQATERKKRNYVRGLKDEDGREVTGEQLKNFVANQYQQLFQSSAHDSAQEVLESVSRCVTTEMNQELLEPFMGEDVWEALQEMGDLKATGADGIPVIFYKKFWSLVGERVKSEVLGVLNGGEHATGMERHGDSANPEGQVTGQAEGSTTH